MKITEMRLGAIGLDKDSGQSVVLLRDMEGRRALPIWVGLAEVRAISNAVNNITTPRPLTHELLFNTIRQLGCDIKQVMIVDMKGDTFIAEIILKCARPDELKGTITLDSRPSDAISLALMCDAPIYVSNDILQAAGISADPDRDNREAMEFKQFIDGLKASDFTMAATAEAPKEEGEGK